MSHPNHATGHFPTRSEFLQMLGNLLGPEWGLYRLVLVYSIAISLLTLAVPISVQMVIDSVVNTAMLPAVLTISLLLLGLLLLSGIMTALRAYVMELFNRRIYSRITSEIALLILNSRSAWFREQDRLELFNRYFDIMTLKKYVPSLLTNGFSLLLQSVIGFVVVSAYHMYFFIFVLSLILLLYLIWRIWGWGAITSMFAISEAKYETSAWLENLVRFMPMYKAQRTMSLALTETDRLVHQHIDCQERHFKYTFSQLISLLLLYALTSAVLLGIGGWLVIIGQLTLGQLVAAELIMSAIFSGLPVVASYLDQFYYISAAVEELSRLKKVPQCIPPGGTEAPMPTNGALEFHNVRLADNQGLMNFSLPGGSFVQAQASDYPLERLFGDVLLHDVEFESGYVSVGGIDTSDADIHQLRDLLLLLDGVDIPPATIREFLKMAQTERSEHDPQHALESVELEQELVSLRYGANTPLTPQGWPLSPGQLLRLKLAAAILFQPKVLVLGEVFDLVEARIIERVVRLLSQGQTTVIYFSRRQDLTAVSHRLQLDHHQQTVIPVEPHHAS